MQKISGGQDSPPGEGGAAGFGGEGDTGESKAELHGGHHYLQTMVGLIPVQTTVSNFLQEV